jgi:hypothetical protein
MTGTTATAVITTTGTNPRIGVITRRRSGGTATTAMTGIAIGIVTTTIAAIATGTDVGLA